MKALPHPVKLFDVRTRRLLPGQSVVCILGGAGDAAEATLIDSLDDYGKVRPKRDVTLHGITQLGTSVTTPRSSFASATRNSAMARTC
jgi:hypothetical protein